ncbi:MAG: peroxiredoxin [Candidatus Brocadiae bacterium]|nr:peroxiredoxin [Candidatus Brocadiia bacterium]
MALATGAVAPDFTLKGTPDNAVTLSAHKGKDNVVLLFYPFAFSPVCAEEMCSVRDDWSAFGDLKAAVYAISVDSVWSQKAFRAAQNAPFHFLSDFNKTVSKAYDVQFEKLGDWIGVAKRAAFVIGKDGRIAFAWSNDDPKVKPDLAAIKAALQKLK